MHSRFPRLRLGFMLGVLTLVCSFAVALPQQGGPDDPRSRGSRAAGFAPGARRNVFDLLRSLQTPAERKGGPRAGRFVKVTYSGP